MAGTKGTGEEVGGTRGTGEEGAPGARKSTPHREVDPPRGPAPGTHPETEGPPPRPATAPPPRSESSASPARIQRTEGIPPEGGLPPGGDLLRGGGLLLLRGAGLPWTAMAPRLRPEDTMTTAGATLETITGTRPLPPPTEGTPGRIPGTWATTGTIGAAPRSRCRLSTTARPCTTTLPQCPTGILPIPTPEARPHRGMAAGMARAPTPEALSPLRGEGTMTCPRGTREDGTAKILTRGVPLRPCPPGTLPLTPTGEALLRPGTAVGGTVRTPTGADFRLRGR